VWEARVQRLSVLDALYLLGGQSNVQRPDILVQVFHFSATDDREHVGDLLEVIRDRNCLSIFVSPTPDFLALAK
jgi:hypothetical protein